MHQYLKVPINRSQLISTIPDQIPILKSELPHPSAWTKYLEIAYKNSKFSNFGELSHLVEARVSDFFGINKEQVVTCVNGTLGLTGAIATAPVNNLHWTTPSWTFTATASAISSARKHFSFSDIDSDWRISPTNKKVNVLDVLPFGDDIDLERLENLCAGEVVIDAAASFDALRFSNLNSIKKRYGLVVSFHPTKFPPGPEGGVFISNDIEWLRRFRLWTIFGMDENRQSNYLGTNAKLNEFSSAVILSTLDIYEQKRMELLHSLAKAKQISEKFGLEVIPPISKGFATPYWIIKTEEELVRLIESRFNELSISTRRWWMFGCHNMKAYIDIPREDLVFTDLVARTSLGLPMYSGMPNDYWSRISLALEEIL